MRKLLGFINMVKGDSNPNQLYLNLPKGILKSMTPYCPPPPVFGSVPGKPLCENILCQRPCYVSAKSISFPPGYTAKLWFSGSLRYVGAVQLSLD